jgi:hypothetical protein
MAPAMQGDGSLDRWLRATLVALTVATMGTVGAAAPAAAASRVPRVAVIVGPAGDLTANYRALANQAAAAARQAGAAVSAVYSPDATWPAVARAVDGASVVVYLGHGNGWPSRYRNALYPPSQNGFGLNPVAGGDDRAHQYFGEAFVAKLRLAPNAVVVLSHLCYASGNSEPGLPEGSLDQAVQRVDNYAAGFLAAGAGAVVAEAYQGPAYYVKAILGGRGRIEDIWSASPTANRHPVSTASVRTPGYTLHLDPEHASSGFVRSLVSRGVTADEVRSGATGTGSGGRPLEPSLASTGIRFGEPAFRSLPIAGTTTTLTLPLTVGRSTRIPSGAAISVRWDPILLDSPPAIPTVPVGPTALAGPGGSRGPLPTAAPDAPVVDLVVAEQVGTVVEPVPAAREAAGLAITVGYPAVPGLYRLVATLHTPAGVAYDAATQALLTPVLVRVGGPMAVAYGAPSALSMIAGSQADAAVRVLNAGAGRWDRVVSVAPSRVAGEAGAARHTASVPAHLVATWVSTAGRSLPAPVIVQLDEAVSRPGGSAAATLHLLAPTTPGGYLVLLDVVTPASGALSAQGSAPALISVGVTEVPSQSARPGPTAPAQPVAPRRGGRP